MYLLPKGRYMNNDNNNKNNNTVNPISKGDQVLGCRTITESNKKGSLATYSKNNINLPNNFSKK